MKTRLILFIVLTCCMTNPAFSQQTLYYQSLTGKMQQAKELYSRNEFIVAGNLFSSVAEESDEKSEIHSEALFFEALCDLKLGTEHSEQLMQKFLRNNPESTYTNDAWFELGNTHFRDGHYEEMLSAYENVDPSGLSQEVQAKMTYRKGYACFRTGKYDQAEKEFEKIKDSDNKMSAPAKYYWAHINYLNYKYDEALEAFEQLKDNPAFESVIPYYISQIYYMQGRYAEVVEIAEPLLETSDREQKAALSKILGNSWFHLNQFSKAIPYFETYFQETHSMRREENYMLGYCYYITGHYEEAIPPLEQASNGQDLLAQNAYYHLADCYIRTGDKNKARIAFEAASSMDFNPGIKEDALFNFAKITYELSYSPFNETIRAFDKYIALYPNSERNDDAYNYLVKVYMSTNNFKDAVTSIEKIQVKTPAVKKAYQRVTFFRGLELFNNLDYPAAIENMNKSLANGDHDQALKTRAIYWKAEAQYRMENYDQAIAGFQRFLNTPGAASRQESETVYYSLGYACFKVKDYDQAAASFQKFIAGHKGEPSDKLGDAYNRLADCYYINRDYSHALAGYEKAFNLNIYDPDYALYQVAVCQGLQKGQEQKINSLSKLIQTFPESALVDDAVYELGRTNERINRYNEAIHHYMDLLQEYPQSSFCPKAMLQLGLIYYNQSDYKKSMDYYKQIPENFPGSPEVQPALLGVKNDYVALNQVDAYFTYASQVGAGMTVSTSEKDSLSYMAAEKLVMNHDPQARIQLERYLQQYPSGSFSINAHFYLGEEKYASGDYTAALSDYEYVLDKNENIFTEPALAKAAELEYNAADYNKALSLYQQMEKVSNTSWNLLKAQAGQMRCFYDLGDFTACIDASRKVLNADKLTDVLKREASYKLAKSFYLTENYQQAFPLLKELATDTKSSEGAESKYLLTEILVNQNKPDEAENEVMDFISKNTPHQFWLAKSFILLADIYLSKGDEFEAKHTLKSIVDNYPVSDDGIIETASAKLKHLEELEQQQQQKKEDPMKIDINKQ